MVEILIVNDIFALILHNCNAKMVSFALKPYFCHQISIKRLINEMLTKLN